MFKQQILLNQLNDEKNVYEDQIAQKKDEIESLKRELDKVKTPYYIEKLAREKLKMVMPDEIIFIIENN
jgi:cell division protein FtsB